MCMAQARSTGHPMAVAKLKEQPEFQRRRGRDHIFFANHWRFQDLVYPQAEHVGIMPRDIREVLENCVGCDIFQYIFNPAK